jgi:hypothetical protein
MHRQERFKVAEIDTNHFSCTATSSVLRRRANVSWRGPIQCEGCNLKQRRNWLFDKRTAPNESPSNVDGGVVELRLSTLDHAHKRPNCRSLGCNVVATRDAAKKIGPKQLREIGKHERLTAFGGQTSPPPIAGQRF